MAEEQKKEKEEEKKESKPKDIKIILIFALISLNMIAMLAVAGFTFYAYVKQPKKESIVDVVTDEKRANEVINEEVADEDDEGDGIMGPTFPLERFTVNLADKDGSRYLSVHIDLELSSENLTDEIEKRLPQIRDTILVLLSSKRYDQIETIDGKRQLRDEIMHTISGLLTTGRIKNVYFTNFVIN